MAHRFAAKGRRQVTDMAMPTEVRERFEREKEAYWQQRDELLRQYRGKWVAIVNGQVVAVGDSARAVIWEAFRKTGSTVGYVACVGDEERTYAIRQAVTGHFDESHEHPIPKVTATVGHMTGNLTTDVSFILDTGQTSLSFRRSLPTDWNFGTLHSGQRSFGASGHHHSSDNCMLPSSTSPVIASW